MPDRVPKLTIFIGYSHKDEQWKDQVLTFLGALCHECEVDLWSDSRIGTGEDWYDEIKAAMERASIAVCLISADYLASDFVRKEEIPDLLKKRKEDGLLLLPLLVSPCPWKVIRWLKAIQMFPRDAKALSTIRGEANRQAALSEFVEYIYTKISSPDFRLAAPQPKWPELSADHVDITRLPETGKDVFGRDEELDLLDKAWEDGSKHLVGFVAWGGVGKSALVNKWVDQMAADNWRGARRVFAWSFYSQGTGERVASADMFIDKALRWFGDSDTADSARSAWDKGQRLAELVQQQPTLLLLDGMEPLQSGALHDKGRITDPALAVLVKELAKKNPGLCVITTREEVADIQPYGDFALQKDLEQISDEAGRALLRVGGIRGTDAELEQVTRDFGKHALAVNLLVPYLQDTPGRQAVNASAIPDLPDVSVEDGKHPRRVMQALAERFGDGPEREVLSLMGLFERPATAEEMQALRAGPIISGLTDRVCGMSDPDWERVVRELRHVRLLAPESHHSPGGLDAHPLVREHFGRQLESANPVAWKEAHNRLYEYYKALPEKRYGKDLPDTIEEMAPLFQAVVHGCRAGRHQEAFDEVYLRRIQRGREFYSANKLGAFGAELSCLSGFFDGPSWSRPVKALTEVDQAFALNEAATRLRALGRLAEALEPMKAGPEAHIAQKRWKNAAISSENLSELSLTLGKVKDAMEYAEQGVKHADKSGDALQRMLNRTTLADALYQAGKLKEAGELFLEAEAMQKEGQPEYPLLYSLQGFQFCDLLLARCEHDEARRRSARTLEWATEENWLLDIALDHLTLGRAVLEAGLEEQTGDFSEAANQLDQAVDGLRKAGQQDDLPRGLLARAELYQAQGDFVHAWRELEEAWEIAMRGGMRLWECDVHLECCRLLLAMVEKGEAEALECGGLPPLFAWEGFSLQSAGKRADSIKGSSAKSPGKPTYSTMGLPTESAGKPAHSIVAAWAHLETAEAMVGEMGYHRRDPEVLLESAHLLLLEGKQDEARAMLTKAKEKIDAMGCHCWDRKAQELEKKLK